MLYLLAGRRGDGGKGEGKGGEWKVGQTDGGAYVSRGQEELAALQKGKSLPRQFNK